ncbi:MAG: response regulator [Candidatus Dormibacteria bacterium]
MIRLLIVDDLASTRDNLQKLLSFEDDIEVCGMAADGRQALDEAHRLSPDIILMDGNMPVMDGIQAAERLSSELPTSPVIIMSVQGDRDYLRRAMQAGAREFLLKPFGHEELVSAIRRVYQSEQRKGTYLARNVAAAPTAAAHQPAPRDGPPAQLIGVFSGKGGVGKTVVAANLAVALAMETRARVALVDLDLQFGDVGVMLNLDHTRSITDLVDSSGQVDTQTLGEFLAAGPEGVRILLAPISPELADLVTTESIRAILTSLRRSFDFVIVDTSSHLAESTLEVIETAQNVLVVSSLTIPAIKDAKLTLKVLESLSVAPSAVCLVINRTDPYSEFNRESVEKNLLCPVAVQIPHDPEVVGESVTRGTPFVLTHPEAPVTQAIRELVHSLVPNLPMAEVAAGPAAGKRKGRRGLFGR